MNKAGSHWSNVEDFGVVWGIRLLLWIHRYIGRWLLPVFMYPVIAYYLLTNRLARDASMAYLARLKAYAPGVKVAPTAWWSFRHFLSFADSILDRVSAWTGVLSADDLVFTNRAEVEAYLDRGQGVLLMTAHLGCLEVCRALADTRADLKLNILVHTKNAERINALLAPMNLHRRLELLEVTDVNPATAIKLHDKISRGEFVVIVGDRVPLSASGPESGRGTMVANFLGALAEFAKGPLILAHVLKCPVMTMFCIRQGSRYHIHCEAFADRVYLPRKTREQDLQHYLALYIERLEHYCQLAPLQWFNFYPYWIKPETATMNNNQ